MSEHRQWNPRHAEASPENSRNPVGGGRGGPYFPDMDLLTYRMEQAEKRSDAMELRLGSIDATLQEIKVVLANVATKDMLVEFKTCMQADNAAFKASMEAANAAFKASMQVDNANFKASVQAVLADFKVSTHEEIAKSADNLRDEIRNTGRTWGIALLTAMVATGLAVSGVMLQGSANQLAAFQAGLATIQAVATANAGSPPPPATPKVPK